MVTEGNSQELAVEGLKGKILQVVFGAEYDTSRERLLVCVDKVEYRLDAAQIRKIKSDGLVPSTQGLSCQS